MRIIPEAMAAAFAQGAAKLCHVWIVTRHDGEVLGFTDHDRALVFDGVVCRADSGLRQGAASGALGVQASDAAVAGVITSEVFRAEDIAAGLYDGAGIAFYTVDWSDPAQFVQTDFGTLARLEARGDGSFVAHVEGPMAALERVIGRRFSHLCDAALGDARCGVVPEAGAVCDKRYRTCVEAYGNGLNFRGFPDLPGEDFLTLYPRLGDVMDGASRGRR